uniref:Uncharacterized protein n=1 Tax=Glossina pallidipes TaxID=7398 RepID=A0A1B0ABI0_GLOPL
MICKLQIDYHKLKLVVIISAQVIGAAYYILLPHLMLHSEINGSIIGQEAFKIHYLTPANSVFTAAIETIKLTPFLKRIFSRKGGVLNGISDRMEAPKTKMASTAGRDCTQLFTNCQ